eukprot:Blabericola_migrator_1__10550@NODE_599_length_7417_cov_250_473605_g426_i3_p8_GENE_NODE_599_length_7417_cov_250_473605_g426_i3NODE_599_length_7417_cov_250_473605_g426_i3_p8_ORF_typecomplete_len160_score23_12GST_C_2/PF13410_6/8_4_NODE_599_length_7417_cov_250_473605_g426_i370480
MSRSLLATHPPLSRQAITTLVRAQAGVDLVPTLVDLTLVPTLVDLTLVLTLVDLTLVPTLVDLTLVLTQVDLVQILVLTLATMDPTQVAQLLPLANPVSTPITQHGSKTARTSVIFTILIPSTATPVKLYSPVSRG